jgi:sugar/nucleoside kinase (ribokinase family)
MNEMCFEDLDLDYLTSARHFHLSSFFLHRALRPRVVELLRKIKAAGLTISLDTNDDPEGEWDGELHTALRYVDVFLPNVRELGKITGTEDIEAALNRLTQTISIVAVKLGAQGAIAQRGKERCTAPALAVEAVDPVGAGDSFDAGFVHQFVRGADLPTCLAFGNFAGAFSTTRPGGTEAFRDREHLEGFLQRNWPEAEACPIEGQPRAVKADS